MQVVAVRLTAEELEALDAAAERDDLNRSEAIRAAPAHYAACRFNPPPSSCSRNCAITGPDSDATEQPARVTSATNRTQMLGCPPEAPLNARKIMHVSSTTRPCGIETD
ncbi:MAG: ribbon-helix-helix protein, CopG family [Propionicimonas sp.]